MATEVWLLPATEVLRERANEVCTEDAVEVSSQHTDEVSIESVFSFFGDTDAVQAMLKRLERES